MCACYCSFSAVRIAHRLTFPQGHPLEGIGLDDLHASLPTPNSVIVRDSILGCVLCELQSIRAIPHPVWSIHRPWCLKVVLVWPQSLGVVPVLLRDVQRPWSVRSSPSCVVRLFQRVHLEPSLFPHDLSNVHDFFFFCVYFSWQLLLAVKQVRLKAP